MSEAYYCYARWGAKAKTDDLEKRYPKLLKAVLEQPQFSLNPIDTLITFDRSTSKSLTNAFDFASIIKASQALSEEINLDKLLASLLNTVITNAGGTKCVLMLSWNNQLWVEGVVKLNQEPQILLGQLVDESLAIPKSLIYTVKRNLQTVVISDAKRESSLIADEYILEEKPKSLLCMPILHQGKLLGIVYLENNLTVAAFTKSRVEIINLLVTQGAISLQNARLYQQSQSYAQQLERSLDSLQQAQGLQETLSSLKRTQAQLIQSEKMSSLSKLVAGIAHEINNPANFIYGNLTHTRSYLEDLLQLIEKYQEYYPNPSPEIIEEIENIDLEFLKSDFPNLITSMKTGTERIRKIVSLLRTFSRLDEAELKFANLHEGIDSSLMLLSHRLQTNQTGIEIIKEYGNLPLVECYAAQINQVFLNILNNAIDALEERWVKNPCIRIQTQINEDNAIIHFVDNGSGIPENIQQRIFDPFFTTKDVGKGIGMGMSISYQIITETHNGLLQCFSSPGKGTEFVVQIPIRFQGTGNGK